MWASQCQANDITGIRAVTVNVTSLELHADGVAARHADQGQVDVEAGRFSTPFDKQEKGKVLMLPGPVWFGGSVFDSTSGLNTPKGQIAVAPMPQWPGTATPSHRGTSAAGRGCCRRTRRTWRRRSTSSTWVTTNDAYQADLAPGFPAYAPAATAWLANQAEVRLLRQRHRPRCVQQAAGQVWPGWGYGKFSQEAIWAATVTPGHHRGQVDRLDAARLADGDHQPRHSRRLPGQPLTWRPLADPPGRAPAARPGGPSRAGHAFVAGYVILLAAFGVVPVVYAHLLRVHQRGQLLRRAVQLRAVRRGLPVPARLRAHRRSTW